MTARHSYKVPVAILVTKWILSHWYVLQIFCRSECSRKNCPFQYRRNVIANLRPDFAVANSWSLMSHFLLVLAVRELCPSRTWIRGLPSSSYGRPRQPSRQFICRWPRPSSANVKGLFLNTKEGNWRDSHFTK